MDAVPAAKADDGAGSAAADGIVAFRLDGVLGLVLERSLYHRAVDGLDIVINGVAVVLRLEAELFLLCCEATQPNRPAAP